MSHLSGKDSSGFTVRVHACPPPGFFKPSRFHPQRNNIRTEWYTGLQTSQPGEIVRLYGLFLKYYPSQWSYHLLSLFLWEWSYVYSGPQLKYHFHQFLFLFVTESSEPPTPHYNSSVLGDLLPRAHLQFLSAVSSQCSAFADGVALLKVWLRQRELDQVGGLQWLFHLLHRGYFLLFYIVFFYYSSDTVYLTLPLYCSLNVL